MKEVVDAFLAEEDLTPEEQHALRRLLAEDPGLVEAFALWYQFQANVREHLSAALPDRGLLVCYALDVTGHADTLSDAERRGLAAAKPALEQAFIKHPGLKDAVQRIQKDAALFETIWEEYTAEEPWLKREDRSPLVRQSSRPAATRWVWRGVMTATLVGFVAITALLLQRERNRVTYETAANEIHEVELADGSTVRLMGGSALSFAAAEKGDAFARQVTLQGRAFFQVTPDEQPFTVRTPTAQITVLGTTFGVDAGEALTEVVLSTGRVALAPLMAQDKMVVLEEGEMSRVGVNALPATPMPVNVAEELGWTGLFLFRGTPVEDIARQLQAFYNIEIEVAPSLLREPVTGTFAQTQRAEDILDALATTLGARVEAKDKGVFSLRTSQ